MRFFSWLKRKSDSVDYNDAASVASALRYLYTADSFKIPDVLKRISNPNVRDEFGNTPFLIMTRQRLCSQLEDTFFGDRVHHLIPDLLSIGMDLNARNDHGKTALMYAIYNASFFNREKRTVHELLKYNVDPFVKDVWGRTALDYAARYQSDAFRDILNLMQTLRPGREVPLPDETDQKLWRQWDKSCDAYWDVDLKADRHEIADAARRLYADYGRMVWHLCGQKQQKSRQTFSSVSARWADMLPRLKKLTAVQIPYCPLTFDDLLPTFQKCACADWQVTKRDLESRETCVIENAARVPTAVSCLGTHKNTVPVFPIQKERE